METARVALAPRVGFVFGAVEIDHGAVDEGLFGGVHAGDGGGDALDDVGDGLADALAGVAILTVAQLEGFIGAGGGARGGDATADGACVGGDFDLDGRIAP
jgi:hypothetical protein